MKNLDLLRITPFFYMHVMEDNVKATCMQYIYEADRFYFQTTSSKTMNMKMLQTLCSGLNHLLLWAKDLNYNYSEDEFTNSLIRRDNELKQKFIIEFTKYIHQLHQLMTSDEFKALCYTRMQNSPIKSNGTRCTESDIQSQILVEQITEFMDNPILMTGVIKYVYDYYNMNSAEKPSRSMRQKTEINLNEHDLFGMVITTVLSKIVHLAFSTYPTTTKADELVFDPISTIISKLKEKILEFYENELMASPMVLSTIMENDYESNIVDYMYSIIDKEIGKERNRSVFENVGITENKSKNRILHTIFSSFYKIIPVLDSDEIRKAKVKTSIEYLYQENWRDFRYVSNNYIRYINSTLHKIADHNAKHATSVLTHTTADDTTETNITYKQEMFLETRNKVALERKKELISLLGKWCELYRLNLSDYESKLSSHNLHIIDTPLRSFIMTTIMNELNEDVTATQLIDRNTTLNLLVVMSHRLLEMGYPNMSKALLARSMTESSSHKIEYYMDDIKKLRKYMIDPVKTERYIKDIAGRSYVVYDSMNGAITITEEFIKFLKEKENPNYKLINGNIYEYIDR